MSPAQFDRGYEKLLKKKVLYCMYTKEGITVESHLYSKYGGFGVYSMDKTGGKCGKLIEQLLSSTFSAPSQAPSLGRNYFMTVEDSVVD
jgi:hypothetical protein